ncbi:hypothetical protein ColKHC_14047 [Colletotrichum higginsianum]|nr:hypothetical protein ColKHC_14047 [Colletotrichum higginsianum]
MDLSSTSTVPEPRSSNLNPDPSLDRNMTPSSPSHCLLDFCLFRLLQNHTDLHRFRYPLDHSYLLLYYRLCRRRCDDREPSIERYRPDRHPFLREHIPGIYAPIGKPDIQNENSNNYNNSNGTNNSGHLSQTRDANSKFCYRHRPDAKCRRAADESKMVLIQSGPSTQC